MSPNDSILTSLARSVLDSPGDVLPRYAVMDRLLELGRDDDAALLLQSGIWVVGNAALLLQSGIWVVGSAAMTGRTGDGRPDDWLLFWERWESRVGDDRAIRAAASTGPLYRWSGEMHCHVGTCHSGHRGYASFLGKWCGWACTSYLVADSTSLLPALTEITVPVGS